MRITPLSLGGIAACVGVLIMVFWLAGGNGSPEPSDHPAWNLALLESVVGRVIWRVVTYLCLPALLATRWFNLAILSQLPDWILPGRTIVYAICVVIQAMLYFAVTFALYHLYCMLVRLITATTGRTLWSRRVNSD